MGLNTPSYNKWLVYFIEVSIDYFKETMLHTEDMHIFGAILHENEIIHL